jgi:quercetin dioxygenase-like cupin family protein
MPEEVRFVLWRDKKLKELPDGVKRRVFTTGKIMVVQYLYEPGAVFPEHHHPQDQIVIVEKGEIEFQVGDRTHRLVPGSLLSIPGNVPHGARVTGNENVESLNIFHPVKEEFLDEARD